MATLSLGLDSRVEGTPTVSQHATPVQAAPDSVASVSATHNGSTLSVSWEAPARAETYQTHPCDTASLIASSVKGMLLALRWSSALVHILLSLAFFEEVMSTWCEMLWVIAPQVVSVASIHNF